jgi:hypothetical protein
LKLAMWKALGLAALFLLVVPAARADEATRLDRLNGVRFVLDGRALTVTLVPQPDRRPADIRADVWGKRIDAICFAGPRAKVRDIRLWPEGQLELSYRFPRDISARIKSCLLEDGATDVAGVIFKRFIRIFGNGPSDKRIGRRLRRHLQREDASAARRVTAIVVSDGVIVIATDLRENRRGRRIARRLCELVQSSGVPGPPPGTMAHSIFSRDDATLERCGSARAEPQSR